MTGRTATMGEPDASCATRVMKRSPDLAFGNPAGCSRIPAGSFVFKLRLSLNFNKLYIRPIWSVKQKQPDGQRGTLAGSPRGL